VACIRIFSDLPCEIIDGSGLKTDRAQGYTQAGDGVDASFRNYRISCFALDLDPVFFPLESEAQFIELTCQFLLLHTTLERHVGNSESENSRKMLKAGADVFVSKGDEPEWLLETLKKYESCINKNE